MHGSSSAGTPAIKREGANLAPDRRSRGNLPSREDDRGRSATTPSEIPRRGWKDILLRVYRGVSENRILTNAGAVTFYSLLALFPGIAALVSIYGLFSDPGSIGEQLDALAAILPGGAIEVIGEQLARLTNQGSAKLGFGFVGVKSDAEGRIIFQRWGKGDARRGVPTCGDTSTLHDIVDQ